MTSPARIELCGALSVDIAGTPRENVIRGRQGRLLLAYLLLHRDRPVRRDELVEALWAQSTTPPSETALAPVLSRLRRALEPLAIEGRDALHLRLPDDAWIDIEVARDALKAARSADDPDAVAAHAAEAVELTSGGLLADLEAPWLEGPRGELEERRLDALELIARASLRRGPAALHEGEAAARAAVASAPFRESARTALMEVLEARGNAAEALRAYEELRTLLRDELGAVPGAEIVKLHERLVGSAGEAPAAPVSVPASTTPPDLVERDAELADVHETLTRLAAGNGGALIFEGPAGIGKTRLLTELRRRAIGAGARVLDARGGVMEREFGYGVARQLFDDTGASETPETAAALRVLADDAAAIGTDSFAVLRAFFAICRELAASRPLVLTVDDLQWADAASLRFVAYLARRVEGLPILLAATIRTGEPDSDDLLLAEIAQEPASHAVRPAPLSREATTALARERFGVEPDDAFAAACQDVTAGNPLLVRQLLTALAAERVVPDADHAAAVRAIGPRAVSRTVLLRLARLPEPAAAIARAIAILGEQPDLASIGRLAGADDRDIADALDALARAEILRDDTDLGFVHPLVRDAVYHEVAAPRRGLEHLRAARVLDELGHSPERIAAQLLLAPPRGDARVVEHLRAAASVALDRGAPEAALAHLERAWAEPPPAEVRAEVALDLGSAAEYLRGRRALEPLRLAWEGATDPPGRARAAVLLARVLLFMETPQDAVDVVQQARRELPAEFDDLHMALRALNVVCVFFGVADPSELSLLDDVARGPRQDGPGARMLTAITSLSLAVGSNDARRAADLAREAIEGDTLLAFDRGLFCVGPAICLALLDPDEGRETWRRIRAFAGRRGSVLDAIGADLWGGLAAIWSGDLMEAIEQLERAYEGEQLFGSAVSRHMGYTPAFLALAWLERGDLERAERELLATGRHDGASDGERFWLASCAEIALVRGDLDAVLALAEQIEVSRPADTHPLWSPWRAFRARALAARGDGDAATTIAADEVALARRIGAPWILGRALRQLAEVGGDDPVALLGQATQLLDVSSARLERAKAHAAYADALAAVGETRAAEAKRATAIELATRCGADGLVARLRGL